jgi:hypothetical protein
VRTATVLVPPERQLFRFSVGEVGVGGLSAATGAVVPVVDDVHAVEVHLCAVIGRHAEVIRLVAGRVNPTLEPDDDVLSDVGAHDRTAAPLVFDAWGYACGDD